jgi:hypothetical protein
MNLKTFKYSNTQHKHHGSRKITHRVCIKNGKGYKCVTHFTRRRKTHHARKPLTLNEMTTIKMGKFIPGLFKDIPKMKINK